MNGFDFSNASDVRIGSNKVNEVYLGSRKIWPTISTTLLTFVVVGSESKFSIDTDTYYSIDGGTTWNFLAKNNWSPIIYKGDSIMWKSDFTENGRGTFIATGLFDVQGNIMSLLGDANSLQGTSYTFSRLFFMNNFLRNARDLILPATTLAPFCYNQMFEGCTSLTSAPVLPATTLVQSCYYQMFKGCTSLTSAPVLPATTLTFSCYYQMFKGCTSLTSAPVLPATTLAQSCYSSMFQGCTSLTSVPALPATTLEQYCYYQMFQGCTSLTSAPVLPATTLAAHCYYQMFHSCTSLSYVKAMFTTEPGDNYTVGWLFDVAGNGTFVKNSAATWNVTGSSGIPSGWTIQTI